MIPRHLRSLHTVMYELTQEEIRERRAAQLLTGMIQQQPAPPCERVVTGRVIEPAALPEHSTLNSTNI